MAAANKGGSIEWATGSRLEGRDKHLLFEYRLSALLCFVRSDSHLNVITEPWNLPAGLASPKLRKGAASRYTISFLSLSRLSPGQNQRQFQADVIRGRCGYEAEHSNNLTNLE
jgi:hypothetical protein